MGGTRVLTSGRLWGRVEPEQHECVSVCLPVVADVSDITRLLTVFNEPHAGVIQAARQLLSDEQAPLRQKLLADLLHHVSQNITAETREQDPSWFEGMRAGMTMAARVSGAGRGGPLWSREAQGDLCLFQIPMLLNRGWTGLWNE